MACAWDFRVGDLVRVPTGAGPYRKHGVVVLISDFGRVFWVKWSDTTLVYGPGTTNPHELERLSGLDIILLKVSS